MILYPSSSNLSPFSITDLPLGQEPSVETKTRAWRREEKAPWPFWNHPWSGE